MNENGADIWTSQWPGSSEDICETFDDRSKIVRKNNRHFENAINHILTWIRTNARLLAVSQHITDRITRQNSHLIEAFQSNFQYNEQRCARKHV